MGRKPRQVSENSSNIKLPPALTEEALENAMISKAQELAYKQLCEGTASSQVITHYLKLGSTKERAERELLEKQKELLEEKTNAIKENKVTEALYKEAIAAFKAYSGQSVDDDD